MELTKNIENNQENNNKNKIFDNYEKYKPEILKVPSDYSQFNANFKIIIIGNSGVGKTCITNQATRNIFVGEYKTTIGMEIYSLFVKVDNKIIKLQIWDTCGQEMYRSLVTNFYRSSALAIMVYAIDTNESFKDLDLWIKELKMNNSPDTKLILVGNKLDLKDKREVQYEEGKKFADNFGFIDFFESSAKTGENIREMFIKVAIILYEEQKKYLDTESNNSFSTFKPSTALILNKNKSKRKKKGCC